MFEPPILSKFHGNICEFKIQVSARVKELRNVSVYIGYEDMIFVADMVIKRFRNPMRFDPYGTSRIDIAFITKLRQYSFVVPVLPKPCEGGEIIQDIRSSLEEIKNPGYTPGFDLADLKCLTSICVLSIDGIIRPIQADYCYGFAGRYRGRLEETSKICRYTNYAIIHPNRSNPVSRAIRRLKDEESPYCPLEEERNWFDVEIPEERPELMVFKIPYNDSKLTEDEQLVLEDILKFDFNVNIHEDRDNIENCLVNLLLAVCYDIRWNTSAPDQTEVRYCTNLASSICYFERFDRLADAVESFIRRSLIYAPFKNIEFSCLCIQDAVEALQTGKEWIIKQLLHSYNYIDRNNRYLKVYTLNFIGDYIQYLFKKVGNHQLYYTALKLEDVFIDLNMNQLLKAL